MTPKSEVKGMLPAKAPPSDVVAVMVSATEALGPTMSFASGESQVS